MMKNEERLSPQIIELKKIKIYSARIPRIKYLLKIRMIIDNSS
jgi:hypothetical protein